MDPQLLKDLRAGAIRAEALYARAARSGQVFIAPTGPVLDDDVPLEQYRESINAAMVTEARQQFEKLELRTAYTIIALLAERLSTTWSAEHPSGWVEIDEEMIAAGADLEVTRDPMTDRIKVRRAVPHEHSFEEQGPIVEIETVWDLRVCPCGEREVRRHAFDPDFQLDWLPEKEAFASRRGKLDADNAEEDHDRQSEVLIHSWKLEGRYPG
jgi:hypothetical protein